MDLGNPWDVGQSVRCHVVPSVPRRASGRQCWISLMMVRGWITSTWQPQKRWPNLRSELPYRCNDVVWLGCLLGSVVSHINITYTYMYTCVGNNMVMMNHEFPQLAGMPPDVQARSQLQELILRKHSTEQMQAQQICFRETLWEIRGFYPQRPRFSEGFLWIFTVKVGQT